MRAWTMILSTHAPVHAGITLIDDVVRANALNLSVAAFVAGVAWLLFATLLYLTERENPRCVMRAAKM
eukprot:COSAG05_NODE_500_length_9234_cov_107.281664_18_plen_68_part_00